MTSWQYKLLKVYFRTQRLFKRSTRDVDVHKERADLKALAAKFKPTITPQCTALTASGIPAEWIVPPGASLDRVVFYLHGGSYNIGSINSHRALAANIANAAQTRALIVDYRLAPEHPYPAALEDALAVYRWLLAGGAAPGQIVIAGDSSGGGLALATLVALRDAGEPLPAAAVCLSPLTDLAITGESWTTNVRADVVIEPEVLFTFVQWYLQDTDPRTPLASPLYADLAGLPPLLIQVGTAEVLLSDSTRFAERAQAAGVDVTLEVWESMQHVWQLSANLLPEARQAIDQIGDFIRRYCK